MISRRAFLSMAGIGALAGPVRLWGRAQTTPAIDPARLRRRLETLSTYGRPSGGTFASGVSRVAYSPADVAARAWMVEEIKSAGLAPRVDAAGNIYVRSGGDPNRPPILFGSHIDSVPGGGNFDGDLGTLAALEVLHAVQSAKLEDPAPAGNGALGSRREHGLRQGNRVQPYRRRRSAARRHGPGLEHHAPGRCDQADRRRSRSHRASGTAERVVACLSGTAHRAGRDAGSCRRPVGIVEGIVAIHRYDVVVDGFANHAGTTPMGERQDALVAASTLILEVRELARSRQGRQVGTVGRLEVEPNSPNVIPGRVSLSVEFRDLSEATLKELGEAVRGRAAVIARDTNTKISIELATTNPAALAHAGVQGAIGRAADRLGLQIQRLPSGAGHDAQMIAALCPMGMIFVPSVGGISHSPRELTSWDDCAHGAGVLLGAVLELDGRDSV